MKTFDKLIIPAVAVISIASVNVAQACEKVDGNSSSIEINSAIECHENLAKDLSLTNRFLSIKFPLSAGNPELHEREAAKLKRLLKK